MAEGIIFRWYDSNERVTGSDWLWGGTHYTQAPALNYGFGGTSSYYCVV